MTVYETSRKLGWRCACEVFVIPEGTHVRADESGTYWVAEFGWVHGEPYEQTAHQRGVRVDRVDVRLRSTDG